MAILEITIQRKAGNVWPVVLEQRRGGGFLTVRTEGDLSFNAKKQRELIKLGLDPLAYGSVLGQALFRETVRDAFVSALAENQGDLRLLLVVEDPDLKVLYWERLCAPL